MFKKFVRNAMIFGLSVMLALSVTVGALPLEAVWAQETENPEKPITNPAVFSIEPFHNPDYTFSTISGGTASTRALPGKDVTILVFGRTTCASSWLTIRNIAESSWVHNENVSVIYVDIDSADAEVIQESIDFYSQLSEDSGPYYQGCEKITFCHDADGKNEEARKMYHMLSGIRGTVSLPMTVMVDKNDVVREILTNSQTADKILPVMNQVIIKGNAAEEEGDKKDDTGKDDAGDDTEKDTTGTDNAEKDTTGKDDTGKDNAGKDDTAKNPIVVSPENVSLSRTSLTYNGMLQQPYVVAKDNQGRNISSTDYTVTYSNNRNVGQATVTIIFKNNYAGTVVKTFTILPKGTLITKVTSKKKGFTVRWKKQALETTGYEIQYATNSKFKGARTLKNIKAKITSKNVTKLKARKKYYIRIRTYKTVYVNENKINLHSDWSNVKKVTTKK